MKQGMKRTFFVSACWDEEARVFVSDSDIRGLHIEAPTIEEFEAALFEHAHEMIFENHIKRADMSSLTIKDMLSSIVWQRPPDAALECA